MINYFPRKNPWHWINPTMNEGVSHIKNRWFSSQPCEFYTIKTKVTTRLPDWIFFWFLTLTSKKRKNPNVSHKKKCRFVNKNILIDLWIICGKLELGISSKFSKFSLLWMVFAILQIDAFKMNTSYFPSAPSFLVSILLQVLFFLGVPINDKKNVHFPAKKAFLHPQKLPPKTDPHSDAGRPYHWESDEWHNPRCGRWPWPQPDVEERQHVLPPGKTQKKTKRVSECKVKRYMFTSFFSDRFMRSMGCQTQFCSNLLILLQLRLSPAKFGRCPTPTPITEANSGQT